MPTPPEHKGWEAARPYVSKEAKPAKIDSLIEKDFCARPLKDLSIFAGFVRRQAASRVAGCRACGAALGRGSRQKKLGFCPKGTANFSDVFSNSKNKSFADKTD
jgi:hypothetical protein